MDYNLLIAAGVFIIALAALFMNSSARFLSIREHATYSGFITREIDNIYKRLDVLERTRPTTGELEAKIGLNKKECKTIS